MAGQALPHAPQFRALLPNVDALKQNPAQQLAVGFSDVWHSLSYTQATHVPKRHVCTVLGQTLPQSPQFWSSQSNTSTHVPLQQYSDPPQSLFEAHSTHLACEQTGL